MEYVYIGKIVNTHGIKGELRIISDFDKKEIVFQPGFSFYLGDFKKKEIVNSYRRHKNFDMVTFEGYDNINQVLEYVGLKVYINREDLGLNDNDYLLDDLIGLNVVENGELLGKIEEIVYNGSGTLLVVEGVKKFYIPNNQEFVKKVDLENKEVQTNNAKGLII